MSQTSALQKQATDAEILKKIVFKGDLSDLTPEQQISYYIQRCQRVGLDPSSKPFDFLEITDKETKQKKITLYANKECAAQLAVDRQVSIYQLDETEENGVYRVTAYARTPDGRMMINKSVAKVKGLEGKNYENAIKRCVTQAIRRTILMICGLGDTDESEIGDIPNARPLLSPETVMTESEAEHLTLSHTAIGLDQWKCKRSTAMLLLNVCKRLAEKGVGDELMRSRLPGGVQSRKDLTEEQAQEAIKAFTHWLDTYNEAVERGAING